MTPSVVVAAGGTGGHVAPALAVAEALRAARPSAIISFVGTRRGLEGEMVAAAGYPLHLVDVLPFARTLGPRRFLAPLSLARAARQAGRILRAERASVVLGMGGYASLPVVAAARLGRIPCLIHEQNAIPGLANRAAARLTRNVAVAFPEAAGHFPAHAAARAVGMPLRRAIASFDRAALCAEARAVFGLSGDRPAVLVFGGSLGAARLNAAAAGLAARWRDRADRQLLVIAGRAHAEELGPRLARAAGSMSVRCEAFVDRMELAYAAADLALCRAGASTVSELAAVGLPAVLVPYPHARHAHQDANARALGGGAIVVRDAEATADRIGPLLDDLLAGPERLVEMGAAGRRAARPRAAEEMAAWLLELAEAPRG